MSKGTLKDLNLTLFEQLERLNDLEETNGENLDREINRAKAMAQISTTIIKNAAVILEAKRMELKADKEVILSSMLRSMQRDFPIKIKYDLEGEV